MIETPITIPNTLLGRLLCKRRFESNVAGQALEHQKQNLEQKLLEVPRETEKTAITEDDQRQRLSQFGAHIAKKLAFMRGNTNFSGRNKLKYVAYTKYLEKEP